MAAKTPEEQLQDWIGLNRALMFMSEEEVTALLKVEKKGRARLRIMMRLYHRLSKLRSMREKLELAKNAKA